MLKFEIYKYFQNEKLNFIELKKKKRSNFTD